ncbi:MAG TPA: phenylalanine--tRNA ligase beta subunit-related protein [Candidatus Paceibacterota bacterium]|nr:phenylalanine--tRNA ligase beta subunit-related protein [Candidatus Paceibacterota bacterium]
MIISLSWISEYLKKPLPKPERVADALTFHACEIEGIERKGSDAILDVKVLPNRAHDCLSYAGLAREIGAILKIPYKGAPDKKLPKATKGYLAPAVRVEDDSACPRYMAIAIDGVKIGPSPVWLKKRLESVGSRSINNVVDATNYVMLELGQPLHAFDRAKLAGDRIVVRAAKEGEAMTTLDGKELALTPETLVIADAESPLGVAGVKGGTRAEIDATTTAIVIESANFEPTGLRRTSQRIGIRTDASKRFESALAPEFAEAALRRVVGIILEIAGTKHTRVSAPVDLFPRVPRAFSTGISTAEASRILGMEVDERASADVLARLGFNVRIVTPRKEVLGLAKRLLGKPYKIGASIRVDAPDAFDCSSFVSYCHAHAGISIPRVSVDQYRFGAPVAPEDLLPGDVVFANSGEGKIHKVTYEFLPGTRVPEGVDHCGIFLGGGKVIHATRKKGKVLIEDLKKSLSFKKIVGYRRMPGMDDLSRLAIGVPYWRLDIERKEDLAEEIARMIGYEGLAGTAPSDRLPAKVEDRRYRMNDAVRSLMIGAGFSEVYTYAFMGKGEVIVANPIASDKKYLRNNLMTGLKAALEENLKYREHVAIFEIGTIFGKDDGRIREERSFAGLMGFQKRKEAAQKEDFFVLKGVLEELFAVLGVRNAEFAPLGGELVANILVAGRSIGMMTLAGFELSLDKLFDAADPEVHYVHPSKYPSIIRDVSLFVPRGTTVGEVEGVIRASAGELVRSIELFDVYEAEDRTSFAFRMVLQSFERTLSDNEANVARDAVVAALVKHEGWHVR